MCLDASVDRSASMTTLFILQFAARLVQHIHWIDKAYQYFPGCGQRPTDGLSTKLYKFPGPSSFDESYPSFKIASVSFNYRSKFCSSKCARVWLPVCQLDGSPGGLAIYGPIRSRSVVRTSRASFDSLPFFPSKRCCTSFWASTKVAREPPSCTILTPLPTLRLRKR